MCVPEREAMTRRDDERHSIEQDEAESQCVGGHLDEKKAAGRCYDCLLPRILICVSEMGGKEPVSRVPYPPSPVLARTARERKGGRRRVPSAAENTPRSSTCQ
ncbi:hypothetical protein BHE74_00041966 [Ensete ventricosum]|nr:hypothetical protein BHE74_00041966 [Ensete ventricosum]